MGVIAIPAGGSSSISVLTKRAVSQQSLSCGTRSLLCNREPDLAQQVAAWWERLKNPGADPDPVLMLITDGRIAHQMKTRSDFLA